MNAIIAPLFAARHPIALSMAHLASPESAFALAAALVLFGFGIGNATSLPPLIAQVEFAAADTPRVAAAIVAASQAAYAFAPAAFGFIRQFGSDRAMFVAAAIIQLGAVVVYLAGRHAYRTRR